MTAGAGGSFRVSCSQKERDRLTVWAAKADRLGLRDQFLAALKAINQRLSAEPLVWGDPNYRLHQLGLLVYSGIYSMFQVEYAVDEANHIVYVKQFRLLPWHPLSQDG